MSPDTAMDSAWYRGLLRSLGSQVRFLMALMSSTMASMRAISTSYDGMLASRPEAVRVRERLTLDTFIELAPFTSDLVS